MGKTVIALVVVLAALIWLPVWIQIVLFVLGIILFRMPTLFLIPAVISDALYAPSGVFRLGNLRMTGLVLVLLIIHWLLVTQTRLGTYDLFQKN